MPKGAYITFEEARRTGNLERLDREHAPVASKEDFERLLLRMCLAKMPGGDDQTSAAGVSSCYTDTRTLPNS